MSYFDHSFESTIEEYTVGINARGPLHYLVAFVPKEMAAVLELEKHPRLRIEGEIDEMSFFGAMQPTAEHGWYILLSDEKLKTLGKVAGDQVLVRFNIADQDHVEIPAELQHALRANKKFNEAWEKLTPGKQRGYAHTVASAKQSVTRESRVEKIKEALL